MFNTSVSKHLHENKTWQEAGISMESVMGHRLSRNLFYCFANHCHITLDIVLRVEPWLPEVTSKHN